MQTPEFGALASDVTIDKLATRVAGAAANCALAASAAGGSVEMIGLVGSDAFGAMILGKLQAARVGTSLVRHAHKHTGMVISLVREDGERTLLSYRGANSQEYGALPEDLVKISDYVDLSGYALQDNASAQAAYALRARAAEAGAHCALDPTYLFARTFEKKSLRHSHSHSQLRGSPTHEWANSTGGMCCGAERYGSRNGYRHAGPAGLLHPWRRLPPVCRLKTSEAGEHHWRRRRLLRNSIGKMFAGFRYCQSCAERE